VDAAPPGWARPADKWEQRNALALALTGPGRPTPLHYYRELSTLWSILEGQDIWAGHVRFSNDSAEVLRGEEFLLGPATQRLESHDALCRETVNAIEEHQPYMMCFCDDGDLLSQWREYAKNGVSIEFDFSSGAPLSVRPADCTCANPLTCPHAVTVQHVRPLPMLYHGSNDANEPVVAVDPVISSRDPRRIAPNRSGMWTRDAVEKVARGLSKARGENVANYYAALTPYIKDSGFAEERESRIIVDLSGRDNEQAVFYHPGTAGLKRPFVRLRYGVASQLGERCSYVRINQRLLKALGKVFGHTPAQLQSLLGVEVITLAPRVWRKGQAPPELTAHVGPGSEDTARDVWEALNGMLSLLSLGDVWSERSGGPPPAGLSWDMPALDTTARLWSDAHWPIRSITLGPHPWSSEVVESIRQFCHNHWWLRHVKVKASRIPYRRPVQEPAWKRSDDHP